MLKENFQSFQRVRQYYEFVDVDVDRYDAERGPRVLMVSAREMTRTGSRRAGKTWQNTHLVYTHGFGAVAAQVNTATSEGAAGAHAPRHPARRRAHDRAAADLLRRARTRSPFVVANTGAKELDYEGARRNRTGRTPGTGGIPIGNILRRALFAWQFKDINLLFSSQITATAGS